MDKPYCKVTNKYWLSRMDGNAKSIELSEISAPLQKYNNRYQLGKIKTSLQCDWGLKEYSYYTRGFYISFKLSVDKLVEVVEIRKKSTKKKQLSEAKRKARDAILGKIN